MSEGIATGTSSESLSSLAGTTAASGPIEDAVEIRLPADSAYLSVLRTATAGLAARLDFTLDEIEDLRIAVDEACSLLLSGTGAEASTDASLVAVFDLADSALDIWVSGPAPRLPDRASFAWAVLEALVGEVTVGDSPPGSFIRMRHERTRRLR